MTEPVTTATNPAAAAAAAAAAGAAAGADADADAAAATVSAEDDAAIRSLVADATRHQGDLEPFLALHTPDVAIVNIAGRRVLGRDVLRAAMADALASPLAQVLTQVEVLDIRAVAPSVALVSCTKHVSDEREVVADRDAPSALPTTGSLTYVVIDTAAGWRIASAQTTPIVTS